MAFIERNRNGVVFMTSDKISAKHAFTTRYGGVSGGPYESMNLGENRGDSEENVRRNYDILCRALELTPGRLVFSRQVHECTVRACTPSDCRELFAAAPYTADGLITDVPGLPLIIFTADCIPVLLHDPVRGAAGAVHAGWRGTVGNIAGAAVEKMRYEYGCKPENIRAAIGPGIGPCCFETGPEVPDGIRLALGGDAERFIKRAGKLGKYMVDLKGANAALLAAAGVRPENIDISGECTMCLPGKYWSHRHTGGVRGSQASIIALKKRPLAKENERGESLG